MPEELVAEISSFPELETTSEAEQMYLITVARETETGDDDRIGKIDPRLKHERIDAALNFVPLQRHGFDVFRDVNRLPGEFLAEAFRLAEVVRRVGA